MVVHVLFPDSIQQPVGGLGEQFGHIYKRLNSQIDFQIMGYPEDNPKENYHGVYNSFPQMQHGSLSTIANQIAYFYASAKCKVKPDLIHAYDWSSYLAGVYASQLFQVPLLCSMQLSVIGLRESGITYCGNYNDADGYWIHTNHEMSEMLGLTFANKIIQVSNAYSKRFPEFENKTVVIENGIEYDFWKTQSEYKFPFGGKNKRKVVYIGRFATMKGIMPLCEAEIPDDIDLYFVGDRRGGEDFCYQAIKNKCNGVNIFHLGYLRGEAKKSLLQSADAVIMPSLHEPFGIVGLEALASKTVLISSFTDGISDYLTPDVGIDCGKTKETIEDALNIFKNMSDEELIERKEKGYLQAEKYDWNNISKKYFEVYKSLI
jgi:glycogen(starch) synthase